MRKSLVLLAIGATALLIACGGREAATEEIKTGRGDATTFTGEFVDLAPPGAAGPGGAPSNPGFQTGHDNQTPGIDGRRMLPFGTPAPATAPAMAPRPAAGAVAASGGEASSQLDNLQRQVISIASLSIEVKAVPAATSQVRTIAESLGGFVEQLSSFGDAKNQQATITLRVPQAQFFTALERLEALGKVQNNNLGSEDVSSQFIDLKARLASALRQEQSLLALLAKSATVTEILTIERELTRVRGEIERLQGQLNFLERRVELATITVSLFPPQEEQVQAPAATLVVEVDDVTGTVEQVKALATTLEGKVDRVFLSVREKQARADVTLRVFSDKFDSAVGSLEGLGEVKVKELHQGQSPAALDKPRPEQPNSYLQLTLMKPVEESKAWLWWAIGGPIGGAALVALLVVVVYRAASRRRV